MLSGTSLRAAFIPGNGISSVSSAARVMLAALVLETPLTRPSNLFIKKGREIWSFIRVALVGNLHENFMLLLRRSPAWQRVPFPAGLPFRVPQNSLIEIRPAKGFLFCFALFGSAKFMGPGSCHPFKQGDGLC